MAGELETLDSDEPLARRKERHHYDRLLMLSDGVFAIAITLLALELRPPTAWSGDLIELVTIRWRAIFGYCFGFLLVGVFWFVHRGLFARLRRVDVPATIVSLLLLLLVALVPAVASLIAEHGPKKAMPVYFLLILAISVVHAALWGYAAFVANLVDASIARRERVLTFLRLLIPPVVLGALLAQPRLGDGVVGLLPVVLIAAGVLAVRLVASKRRRPAQAE